MRMGKQMLNVLTYLKDNDDPSLFSIIEGIEGKFLAESFPSYSRSLGILQSQGFVEKKRGRLRDESAFQIWRITEKGLREVDSSE